MVPHRSTVMNAGSTKQAEFANPQFLPSLKKTRYYLTFCDVLLICCGLSFPGEFLLLSSSFHFCFLNSL